MKHRSQAVFTISFKLFLTITTAFILSGFSFAGEYTYLRSKVLTKINIPQGYHEGLYFDGNNIWVNNGRKGKTWIINTLNGSLTKEIDPAGVFTEAITPKDKDTFFVTDWEMKKIYTARISDNLMLAENEISVAPAHPAGALWNGERLFVITWTRTPMGTKFHILTMDDKFNILNKTPITKISEPAHMAWDGKNLWVSCWYSRRVYKTRPGDFKITAYFRSPVNKTTGIAWDGKYFWVTGTYGDLYKLEVQS